LDADRVDSYLGAALRLEADFIRRGAH